jgi:hypothetical protein
MRAKPPKTVGCHSIVGELEDSGDEWATGVSNTFAAKNSLCLGVAYFVVSAAATL